MAKPGRPVGTKRHGIKYLSDLELHKFNEALKKGNNLRDQVVMRLTLYLGLRVGEVVRIQMTHINPEAREIWIKGLKGGRSRTFSEMEPQLWKKLTKYIRTNRPEDYLFPVTDQTVKNIFKRYAKAAGLRKELSVHSLRHTVAIQMARKNLSPVKVMLWLRHRSIASTQVYFEQLLYERDSLEMNSFMGKWL